MLQMPPNQTEYTLYAYDYSGAASSSSDRWTKLMSSNDEAHITSRAEDLFQSQKYKKIEIQKKYFDNKKGRHQATTFKILENKTSHNYYMLASILLLSLTSVGMFYLRFM